MKFSFIKKEYDIRPVASLSLSVHPYFVQGSSDASGESAHVCADSTEHSLLVDAIGTEISCIDQSGFVGMQTTKA